MSGENIVVYGTTKTLEANGGAITNNSQAQADDATYSTTADGGIGGVLGFPDADFVLTATFGTAPTEGTVLALACRPLDVDGTADTEVPEVTRPTRFIGSFVVNNVTTSQTMILTGIDLPELASYYIQNIGTGQTVSAGWVLKARPRTYKAAA